jgi:hypothetical protein
MYLLVFDAGCHVEESPRARILDDRYCVLVVRAADQDRFGAARPKDLQLALNILPA